ncbi:hypothetical protein MSAN_00122800 [Mycena sanguinolenta]|uniref:Uncharacterized protein n=1 Tax=Mycena sanguinolenta TaxID=230812 RepID=A0A8H6ZGM5_9AGAR|nr:hypothetical protein MSAN_00122800 [Mycena sanguinolenta]
MHSAKARIDGRKSRVTVAIYQGNDAEEKWRQDIAKYIHPNIIQICGIASSTGIHAALFNDDLIPLQGILDHYRESHFMTVYIYACFNRDFREVFNYLYSAFQRAFYSLDCTNWIRRSTGQLCAELTPANDYLWLDVLPESSVSSGEYSLNAGVDLTKFIELLTLERYHHICDWNLRRHRSIALSADTIVNLGAVFRCSNILLEDSVEIAFLPSVQVDLGNWTISGGGTGDVMPNGWTRFQSGDVFNNTLSLTLSVYPYAQWDSWLSQANYIFRRLNIISSFEDYGTASADSFHSC